MDTRTGEIISLEEAKKRNEIAGRHVCKEMVIDPTTKQLKRRVPKVSRNDVCPCGSGLKFKKCCFNSTLECELTNISDLIF
jgi:uncharacterized protein YecA (UPF0149 family)